MAGAKNPSPYVAVSNGGGNRVKRCVGEMSVRTAFSRGNKDSERESRTIAGGQNPRMTAEDVISYHLHALSDLGTCNLEIFLLSSRLIAGGFI